MRRPARPASAGANRPTADERAPSLLATALAALAAVVVLVALASPAQAHGLRLFLQADGTTVHGRVYFADGEPAAGTRVAFHAPAGSAAETASVVTDADGRFARTLAATGPVRVVVDGEEGHRAEGTVTLAAAPAAAGAAGAAVAALDAAQLRQVVEAAVRTELRPLHERIDRLDQRIRLGDALGGVGLLLGAAGAYALWRTRRRA